MTTDVHEPGKRLAAPDQAPADWLYVAPRPVFWKRANLTIEGLLQLPPQAATGKVSLVVNVHGGPQGSLRIAGRR